MKLAFKPRHVILGGMLISTLAAAAWVSKNDSSIAEPTRSVEKKRVVSASASSAQQAASTQEDIALLSLDNVHKRIAATENIDFIFDAVKTEPNIFASKSWYVPPPPPPMPAKPLPPPLPTAPPLPFTFMGLFHEDSGKLFVYLAKGDRVYTVSEGDVVDNTYRIESATNRQLVLTYLPLSIKQTLPTGTGS